MIDIVGIVFAIFCAGIIAWRVMAVVNKQDRKNRRHCYARWLSFGLSYSLLLLAAMATVSLAMQGSLRLADVLWMTASAGMILFDRRQPPSGDPR